MNIKFQSNRVLLFLVGTILFLSCLVFCVNYYIFKYPGNNYFPNNVTLIGLILLLVYFGIRVHLGKQNRYYAYISDLIWYYIVLGVIAVATNAVQLTPFSPIDKQIIAFEQDFGISLLQLVIWTRQHPWLEYILRYAYDFLMYQMVLLPLWVIFLSQRDLLREYYILMLFTVLIGFGFYYFLPTTAPASVFPQLYFSEEQVATGIKFTQIHHHIPPDTINGGLIALPSFHAIWALLSLYLIRKIPVMFIIFVPINILILLSCVLLGWHYVTDIVASILLLIISRYFFRILKSPPPLDE